MTMRYSDDELRARLRLGEDTHWEFKGIEFRGDEPVSGQRDTWADEIVAFANAQGGQLLLGISDHGVLQGLTRQQLDRVERQIIELCRDSIKPPIPPATHKFELDGKASLLVEVQTGYAQHEYKGRAFTREGSSKRLLSPDERLRLAQRRGQARFRSFDESPVANTGITTLTERLWKPLISADQHTEPAVGLQKLGLLTDDEFGVQRASVGGVLLCTERPEEFMQQAVIIATRYHGGDESTRQMDAQTITGPLQRQVATGVSFVRRNMWVGAVKDPGRLDLPEYSMEAVFEGLVNAVAHRDYTARGMRIRLRMFDDRLEICSPGSLPNGITIDQMSTLQATRNVVIASNLSRMRVSSIEGSEERRYFMETRGDGVIRIQRATHALTGRMPRFEVIDDVELRLTIPAAIPSADSFRTHIRTQAGGKPVEGTNVLAVFPNGTYRQAVTDRLGVASLDLYTGTLPMTVYAASTGMAGCVVQEWIPAESQLAIDLQPLPGGGSVIIPDRSGHIPLIRGRLNPILDDLNRAYLYASNVAINDGEAQPVAFRPGAEDLKLVDAFGNSCYIRIVAITGSSSLIEYRPE